jgi:hypothetical protein
MGATIGSAVRLGLQVVLPSADIRHDDVVVQAGLWAPFTQVT